jgi:asparagine synthase (glutamine-hydrolysing)
VCGIAGVVDLAGRRAVPPGVLPAMAAALYHRGPDEDGFYKHDGLEFASRRLSIIGLHDGRQPIFNEDKSVALVLNGELFEYPERRRELQEKGHRFRTSTDSEIVPHMWEEHGEGMFEHLRGQFAFALWDSRDKTLILARDRAGICPLFWTTKTDDHGTWLIFASEIKGIFASGMVRAYPDPRGLNHIFTYFAMPGPITCFEGISSLLPGQFIRIQLGEGTRAEQIQPRFYWQIDFPDRGHEEDGDAVSLTNRFEQVLTTAVEKRLRADVPVVSYLSGGVDSSVVVALATKVLGRAIPTFTVSIQSEGLNEESEAALMAKHVGSESIVVPFGGSEVMATYPALIKAAEYPVVDTACAALLSLAKSVHSHGYKVALTGEGSDEWMAGYPWFKIHRIVSPFDSLPGVPLGQMARRFGLRVMGLPRFPWSIVNRNSAAVGGYNGWLDVYGLMSLSRLLFFSEEMRSAVGDHVPYEDLQLDTARMAKWHPLNRALALGARVMLGGMLLAAKGDRVAMNSSVETRYPFLDDDVIGFLAGIHPKWKLRGLRDKYILRLLAERWVPQSIAWRKKAMFRAPMDAFHLEGAPEFIEQLLSPESLRKTGYFDVDAVQKWRTALPGLRMGGAKRTAIEMGLVGVTATQLWHQTFIDSSLCNLSHTSVHRARASA